MPPCARTRPRPGRRADAGIYTACMSGNQEIEIKFRINDVATVMERLAGLGFRLITTRTHEMNTLYDLPGGPLRRRGALLRVRKYGHKWTVTYKDRGRIKPGRHKTRREIETPVEDGQALVEIFEALGFKPSFAYEKFRSEWTGGPRLPSGPKSGPNSVVEAREGHVVIDETPIGNFGEIEGSPQWIDEVARRLGISTAQYITASYAELFVQWKKKTGNKVTQMRFAL
jgi:adenylate cyclase, class 2